MTTVRLDWHEVFHAASCGVMRRIQALKNDKPTRFEPRDPWAVDIEGACAELAVARLLKRYWHALVSDPNRLPGDAGEYQVRSTTHGNGQLVVYEHDDDDATFVLVTGKVPLFTVRGWLPAEDAKRGQWWREDAKVPAYFVPQSELRPIEEML